MNLSTPTPIGVTTRAHERREADGRANPGGAAATRTKGASASSAAPEQAGAGQDRSPDAGPQTEVPSCRNSISEQIAEHTDAQGKATPLSAIKGGGYNEDSRQLSFGKQGRGATRPAGETRPSRHDGTPPRKTVRLDVVTHMDERGLFWEESVEYTVDPESMPSSDGEMERSRSEEPHGPASAHSQLVQPDLNGKIQARSASTGPSQPKPRKLAPRHTQLHPREVLPATQQQKRLGQLVKVQGWREELERHLRWPPGKKPQAQDGFTVSLARIVEGRCYQCPLCCAPVQPGYMLEHFENHLRRRSGRSRPFYELPAWVEPDACELFRKCPVCSVDFLASSELGADCSYRQRLMHHLCKHPTQQLCRFGLNQALLLDDYGAAFTPGYQRRQIRAFSTQLTLDFHLSVLQNLSVDHQAIYLALFRSLTKFGEDLARAELELGSLHSSTEGTSRQLSMSAEMRSDGAELVGGQHAPSQFLELEVPDARVSSPVFLGEAKQARDGHN